VARLYSNENFPLPVVTALRSLGHDVLTTLEAGMSGQAVPDDEVLSFATTEGRALLTLNRRHFVRLHTTGGDARGDHCLHVRPGFRCTGEPNRPGDSRDA
jgi:hypothetical protein